MIVLSLVINQLSSFAQSLVRLNKPGQNKFHEKL